MCVEEEFCEGTVVPTDLTGCEVWALDEECTEEGVCFRKEMLEDSIWCKEELSSEK